MADKSDPRPTSRRRGGAPAGGDAAKPEQPGKTPAATDPEQPKTPTSKDLTEVGASSPASVVPAPQSRATQGLFGVSGPGDTSGFSGLTRPAGGGVPVTSSPRPYGGYLDDVADALQVAYPHFDKAVISVLVDRGEITFYVRREHLLGMCKTLRDNASLRFELCSSISGVDYLEPDADTSANPHARERLHSVYHLTSMTFRRRIRLEVAVPVEDPHIPSVYSVYPTADWQERETWDMYGIIYDGHPALTRILMPDDWDGFPQRKDYPLGGIPVEYKGASIPPPDERRVYR